MAIHFQKVDSRIKARIVKKLAQDSSVFLLLMDCHAANAARNDGENFNTILRIAVGLWELCDFWGRS